MAQAPDLPKRVSGQLNWHRATTGASLSQFQQRRRLWLSCHDALPRRQQISDTNGHGVLRSHECCLLEGHET
jgi:hypothetical protein